MVWRDDFVLQGEEAAAVGQPPADGHGLLGERPAVPCLADQGYGLPGERVDTLDVGLALPPKGDDVTALKGAGPVILPVQQNELTGMQRGLHRGAEHDERPYAG
jgi:hypothetical protein